MPATDAAGGRARHPARGRLASGLAAVLLFAAAAGCGRQVVGVPGELPRFVHRGSLSAPPGSGRSTTPLAWPWWRARGLPWPGAFDFGRARERNRIHPELVAWLASGPDSARTEVIVGWHDPLRLPRLPVELLSEPPASRRHVSGSHTTTALLGAFRALRAPQTHADSAWLVRNFGARVLETYWITRGMKVSIRRDSLALLALDPRVTGLLPVRGHEGPPCDEPPAGSATIADGAIAAGIRDDAGDGLAARGYGSGPLALIDTGAWRSHALLAGLGSAGDEPYDTPSLRQLECLTDPEPRADEAGDVDAGSGGHGTASAAILVGGDALGPGYAGLTRAQLTVYRGYNDDAGPTIAYDQLERTLQAAAGSASVLGVEVQGQLSIESPLGATANGCFEGGTAILAVVGNGGMNAIASPGSARGVLAIGAREVGGTERHTERQGWNKAVSTLAKPELQAPTSTWSASTDGEACLQEHGATSGALPYALAAAFLLRNWLADGRTAIDPGQVYSALIACGTNTRPQGTRSFPLAEGAGVLVIPRAGDVWWGCVDAGSFSEVEIKLDRPDGGLAARYQAAIWWEDPEPLAGVGRHSDFDLEIRGPGDSETLIAKSKGKRGTFERVEVDVPAADRQPGEPVSARLRILGRGVGLVPRRVYWTAIGRD